MATTTDVSPLKINYLTQSQYNTALANNQINANELYLTPADDTVNISIATNSVAGIVKPWYYHSVASSGPTAGSNATTVTVNGITTDAGKYYAVEMDKDGRMFVNVPWANSDVNVKQNITTANAWKKILSTYGHTSNSSDAITDAQSQPAYYTNVIAMHPSTGTLRANIYRVQDNVELQWNSTDESLDFVFI